MDVTKYLNDAGVEKTWPARLMVFSVSALLILQQLMAAFTWIGLGVVLVLQLIGFFTLVKTREELPACGSLHGLFFVDMLCMLGIRGVELYEWFDALVVQSSSGFERIGNCMEEMPWVLGMWILAILFCWAGSVAKPALSLIGKLLFCVSLQFVIFGELPWLRDTFSYAGLWSHGFDYTIGVGLYAFWILLVDVVLVLLWHFAVELSVMYGDRERKPIALMGFVLFGLLFVTQMLMPQYYMEKTEEFWMAGGPESLFPLGDVCLAVVVLLVLSAVTAFLSGRRLWCDSLFLLLGAAFGILCGFLMPRCDRSMLLLLLPGLFVLWCFHAMKKESRMEKVMRTDPRIAAGIQLAGCIAVIFLTVEERLLTLFVTVLFATLLYSLSMQKTGFTGTRTFWILLLTGCTLECLAAVTAAAYPVESFAMLVRRYPVVTVVYAAAVLTVLLMPVRGKTPAEPYRKAVFLPTCIGVTVMCAVLQLLVLL